MAGRPKKDPGEKMTVPLRIMLTAAQDELIRQAADGEVSAWARPILLEAARAKLAAMADKRRQKKSV